MEHTVAPARLAGRVLVPASKSHTIRALIIATLAEGQSILENPLESADTRACVETCRALGAAIDTGDEHRWKVRGTGGALSAPANVIDVGNSGTTLYMSLAAAALGSSWSVFTGDEQIRRRSAGSLLASLVDLGAEAFSTRGNGCAPIALRGPIAGGRTAIACPTSQYLSALLLACPLARGESHITVTELNERPYVAITLDWLDRQGIRYERSGLEKFRIPGGQSYRAFTGPISGDFSSATFFFCAAAVTGATITVAGLDRFDPQGDKAVLDILEAMGCRVRWNENEVEIEGRPLDPIEADLNAIPDALPALAVTACYAGGTSRLGGVPQARLKETDRIAVMREELTRMGARIEEEPDGLVIHGEGGLQGARVDGHGDHRVVMALAVGALAAKGETTISTAEAASVTFPDFFRILDSLRR
jgi:3-phosphoshikimate 1-carboxyvinyltransferase